MLTKDAINQFTNWRKFKVKEGTVRGYDRELRNFCLFLRNPEIENITLSEVMEYLNGMADLGWDRNSFVGKCMALRKFFEFYRLQGYQVISEELIPIPDKEPKLPRVATDEQFKELVAAIPQDTSDPRHIRNLAIISLLWDTGARNGEICSLNVKDLDLTETKAIIRTEKAKTRRPFREIFWSDDTNDYLIRWLKKREHLAKVMKLTEPEALFVSVTSMKCGDRFSIKGVGEMLRRYSNRAKLPYINAHSFRHHRGHHIIKSGGSTADVMNILGHASVQSTTIYTMMHGKELEQRARLFLETRKGGDFGGAEKDPRFEEALKGLIRFMKDENEGKEAITVGDFERQAERFFKYAIFMDATKSHTKVPFPQFIS
jgi:site-specific recombinase XerD